MALKLAHAAVIAMAVESAIASSAFAYEHNWKLATYWLFVSAINAVASTF